MDAAQAKAVARAAYIFSYPLVRNYADMYTQAVDRRSGTYGGGFGRWMHLTEVAPAEDGRAQLHSIAWLDLRSQPWMIVGPQRLQLPVTSNRQFDLWGFAPDVNPQSARNSHDSPPSEAGTTMFAASGWLGEVPSGLDRLVRTESLFVASATRSPPRGENRARGGPRRGRSIPTRVAQRLHEGTTTRRTGGPDVVGVGAQ